MNKDAKIFVAGHNGLVGSALVRTLEAQGYSNLILKTRKELDLTLRDAVAHFFETERPDYVFLAAAKVGGILANNEHPAEFIYDNLQIQVNIIQEAYLNGVKKLLFLGSSCIYPKMSPQPIKEEYLMTGPLEPTNSAYAMAKIAGIEMCQAYNRQYGTHFISVMPTNLYGINDNFDLQSSHVLPALVRRFHEAKINNLPNVTMWGTGSPRREFLFADDLANACVFLMKSYDGSEIVNIGCGEDVTILELAQLIQRIVGYQGQIELDTTKPDGTPRKLLDVSKLTSLGWKYSVSLEEGIRKTYDWFLANEAKLTQSNRVPAAV